MSKSWKRQYREANAELTELRRMLARIFPSKKKTPHKLWQEVRRLSRYAQELAELAEPITGRPTAASSTSDPNSVDTEGPIAPGGRSAEQPIYPGVRLKDRPGDAGRTLYHAGSELEAELDWLAKGIERLIDQSADYVRGLDRDSTDQPSRRRPRCEACGEIMGDLWRYCPYCATPRKPEPVKNSSNS